MQKEQATTLEAALAERAADEARYLEIHKELQAILAWDYDYCCRLARVAVGQGGHVKALYNEYTREFLDRVSSMFEHYTGHRCAACVKMLCAYTQNVPDEAGTSPDERRHVLTSARDSQSLGVREKSYVDRAPVYPARENTAFDRIMSDRTSRGYYAQNDLHKLPHDQYWNSNPDWMLYYDAVAVAALKKPLCDMVISPQGFLCVDNKGGGFDYGSCQQLLECCASILYYAIRMTLASSWKGGEHEQ